MKKKIVKKAVKKIKDDEKMLKELYEAWLEYRVGKPNKLINFIKENELKMLDVFEALTIIHTRIKRGEI